MGSLKRGFVVLISFILSGQVGSQETYIWASDNRIAVEPDKELGFGTNSSTSAFLVPDISPVTPQGSDISNWPNTLVSTQASSIFYFTNGYNNTATIMPQRVLSYSASSGGSTSSSILFMTNQSFFLDNRNIGNPPTRSTQLIGTTLLGTDSSLTATMKCFDSRLIDKSVVIVCKNFVQSTQNSYIKIFYVDITVTPLVLKSTATSSYKSANPYLHQISWTGYVKSQSCDTVEDMLMVTDLRFNSSVVTTKGEPVVVFAGYAMTPTIQTRDFGVSDLVVLAQGPAFPSWLGNTFYVHYATNTYSVVTVNGQTTCKNNLFVLGEDHSVPGNKQNCWTDGSIDDTITSAIRRANPITYTFDIRCYPSGMATSSRIGMLRVWRDSANEVYLKVRAFNDSATNTQKIIYEALALKTSDMTVSTPSTQFRNVELFSSNLTFNKDYGFQNYPRLFVVYPEALVGICWTNFSTPLGNGIFPIPGQNQDCQILEYISFENSTFSSSDVVTLTSCFYRVSKQYGPFISLGTQVDSSLPQVPTGLLAYKRYLDLNLRPQENLTLTVYDLSSQIYSVRLTDNPVSTLTSWMTATNWPDFNLNQLNNTNITVLPVGSRYLTLEQSNPLLVGYFKDNCTIMVDSLTNRLHNSPEQIGISAVAPAVSQLMTSWRFSITYPTTSTTLKTVLLEDHLVELDEVPLSSPKVYSIQVCGYNISRTPSATGSDPTTAIGPKFNIGSAFTSTDPLFSYGSLKKMYLDRRGLFMIFQANATGHGLVRFDTNMYGFQYRKFGCPMKVIETASRIFIMTLCLNTTAAIVSVEMTQPGAGKNLYNTTNLNRTFLVDPDYQVTSIDDLDIFITSNLKSVIVSVFARARATGGSPLHTSAVFQYTWDDQTVFDKFGFVLKNKKEMSDNFLSGDSIGLRCVYRDLVTFLHNNVAGDPNNITVTVLNTTKMSMWDFYETTLTSPAGIVLQCARNFINLYTASLQKSTLIRVDADMASYRRIRSVISGSPVASTIYAVTPNMFIQLVATNKFVLTHLTLSKVYVLMNSSLTYTSTSPLMVSTGLLTSNVTISNGPMTSVVISTSQLTKPSMTKREPIYIGSETFVLQQKILYDASQKLVYSIEDNFRLPMSFFDVQLKGNIPAGKISSLERLRRIGEFDLWTEASEFPINKRCGFAVRGTNDVALMDDVMMRVESGDDGFCIQLSRVSLANSQFSVLNRQDFPQSSGVVVNCKLLRDASLFTDTDVAKRRASGPAVNYGIACVHTDNGVKYIWMMLLPVNNAFDNPFKPVDYLIKTPIQFFFTDYRAMLVGNSIYLTFLDKLGQIVYYQNSVFTYGSGTAVSNFTKIPGSSIELIYTAPFDTSKAVTGIALLVSGREGTGVSETYFVEKYRVLTTGDMQLQNATTKINERMPLSQPISTMVCSYQNIAPVTPFASCVYMYSSCRNAMFYWVDYFNKATSMEQYVSPLVDLELRQIKAIFYQRFWYLVLSYSPLTGRKFIQIYKHANNATVLNPPPRTAQDVASADLVTHDALEITQTRIDTETVEMNMFFANGNTFLALKDGSRLILFQLMKFQIAIDSHLSFKDIAETQLLVVDHMQNQLISVPLSVFFREQISSTLLWMKIFGVAAVITIILTGIYLFFKKRRADLERELQTQMAESQKKPSSSKSPDQPKSPSSPKKKNGGNYEDILGAELL